LLRLKNLLMATASWLILLSLSGHAAKAEPPHARVLASHAALQAAQDDYRQRRTRGALAVGEEQDYQAYIEQLRERFLSACEAWKAVAADRVIHTHPCPAGVVPLSRAATIDQAQEKTRLERTDALARELDTALSEFDEMLLREQERVKAATPPSADAGGGHGAGGAGGAGAEGAQGAQADGEEGMAGTSGEASATASTSDADSMQGAAGTGSGAGPSGQGGHDRGAAGTPPDIPDGSDDDVVARQLREAAENETDPQLRARLWEEYRRYKRGTR